MKQLKIGLLFLFLFIRFVNAGSCVGFTDVTDSDNICDDLTFAKESLWISGYPDGSFKPNQKVNRAEFTKIVMNATISKQSLSGQNCFYDSIKKEYEIKSKEWYSGYVCTAKSKGIIKGKKDGLFHPEEDVNYVEALKIVLKSLGFKSQEWLGHWFDTYLTEANAMNLSIYPNKHLVTRGEMITLMRSVYSKHTQRILTTSKWEERCHAKEYYSHKLKKVEDRNFTCEERWSWKLFTSLGVSTINNETTLIRYEMDGIQDSHDIAYNAFKGAGAIANLYGSAADGAFSLQLEVLKTAGGIIFDASNHKAKNLISGVFDTGVSIVQKSGQYFLNGTVTPSPWMYVEIGLKMGEVGTDIWGAWSLNKQSQKLINYAIARSYLVEYYQYGADNGLVNIYEAKIDRTGNDMYDTIYHYAVNIGLGSLEKKDVNEIVQTVEDIKDNISHHVQKCYFNGECLAQEQKNTLTSYDVFTIDGKQTIYY